MTNPEVRYDAEVDAAFIRFSHERIIESEEVRPGVVLDFDAQGRIVAMEVMGASGLLTPAMLTAA